MPNIRYRQRDDIVPHHLRLRRRVEDPDPNHCQQQVDVAELQGDDVRAERQVLGPMVQDLVGDEGVRVEDWGEPAGDAGRGLVGLMGKVNGGEVQGEWLEDCEDEAWEGGEDGRHFSWL